MDIFPKKKLIDVYELWEIGKKLRKRNKRSRSERERIGTALYSCFSKKELADLERYSDLPLAPFCYACFFPKPIMLKLLQYHKELNVSTYMAPQLFFPGAFYGPRFRDQAVFLRTLSHSFLTCLNLFGRRKLEKEDVRLLLSLKSVLEKTVERIDELTRKKRRDIGDVEEETI